MLARVKVQDLRTPALVVDIDAFDHNLDVMRAAHPGPRLRPHVKAHKTTEIARRQADAGHLNFTCATPREVIGMAAAGLGGDLLLANEVVDPERLETLAALTDARVTIAVDSDVTIDAAARAGLHEVLVDVNVGLPRCGCDPEDAGRLADHARARGLNVRGVMGYEGHIIGVEDRGLRSTETEKSMQLLLRAGELAGGDIVSAGGTGTWDINVWANEIQAGSYVLMDNAYAHLDMPFQRAMHVSATVVSVSKGGTVSSGGWAVADCGLKALGMDHGDPVIDGSIVWSVNDEHVIFSPEEPVAIGERIKVWPSHIDPTVAYHERMQVAQGDDVVETWEVDLRGW
jgi:D-serine deaminase-like pyridoxal phosphate-dependent protein